MATKGGGVQLYHTWQPLHIYTKFKGLKKAWFFSLTGGEWRNSSLASFKIKLNGRNFIQFGPEGSFFLFWNPACQNEIIIVPCRKMTNTKINRDAPTARNKVSDSDLFLLLPKGGELCESMRWNPFDLDLSWRCEDR